eukprot:SAG22_NODE_1893_length_3367_cov_2.848531_7_plen_49_part_01
MKDYHNYAASKIQSVLKSPSTQVVNMHGRKYQQRDWKSYSYQEDSDWRK